MVSEIMDNYVYRNHFYRTDWNGEPVYLNTDSAEGGYRYFKWSYINGEVHIEAWMKGTFGQEDDLSGGGKKRAYRDSLEQLIMGLQNFPKDNLSVSYGNHETCTCAAGQNSDEQRPVYTQQWMTGVRNSSPYMNTGSPDISIPGNPRAPQQGDTEAATSAYTLSLVALILSFVFPLVGLMLAIIGLRRCKTVIPTDTTGKAGSGKKMCTIAIVIATVWLVCSFIFPMLFSLITFFFTMQNLY